MDPFANTLIWSDELGIGRHMQEPMTYSEDYWTKYQGYDNSDMGKALTKARFDFVRQHCRTWSSMVDIGIGAGRFVLSSGCLGYDVNPHAVAWLKANHRWHDIYRRPMTAITCWDSLEHIVAPWRLLDQAMQWVFVSLPVFDGVEHCKASKHYRPGEHVWYFTDAGFDRFMRANGFKQVAKADFETALGREGINSYAYLRHN